MNLYNIKIGDLVSNKYIPKTLGVVYREIIDFPPDVYFDVYWLVHPDNEVYGQDGTMNSKYVKPFKPWCGFYNKEVR